MLNRHTLNNRHLAAVAAVAATAVGGAVAVSQVANSADQRPPVNPIAAQPTIATPELDPALTSSFALFREQRASAPPAAVTAMAAGPTRHGRNAAFARRIQTATGPGWIVPGNGYVCIVVPDPVDGYGSSCNPIADAVRRGLAIELRGGSVPAGKAVQTRLLSDRQAAAAVKQGRLRAVPADGVVSATVAVDDTDAITRGEP